MLGNKANKLIELKKLGYNVPEFISLNSDEIISYISNTNDINILIDRVHIEIGDCLVSIRSSPVHSMPGMMDTILNFDFHSAENFRDVLNEVYQSYYNPRAILYRKINNIQECPPGIVIQKMVFGNKDEKSGSGVFFTRDNFGQRKPIIEYAKNTQGIDVVDNSINFSDLNDIEIEIIDQINELAHKLETDFKFPQDVEFTIESGNLYILQTRDFVVGNAVDLEILFDLLKNGIITKEEFLLKIENFNENILQLKYEPELISIGVPIVPGIAFGQIGIEILFKDKIYNDDLDLLNNCKGLLTKEGSVTAHVSNICRIMNKPYIIHTNDLNITDCVIMDGSTGKIYKYDEQSIKTINKKEICAVLADF